MPKYIVKIFLTALASTSLLLAGCESAKRADSTSRPEDACSTSYSITVGDKIDPKDFCDVPDTSTVAIISDVDTSKPGTGTATVTITTKDGSIAAYDVEIKVHKVKLTNNPDIKIQKPGESASPSASPSENKNSSNSNNSGNDGSKIDGGTAGGNTTNNSPAQNNNAAANNTQSQPAQQQTQQAPAQNVAPVQPAQPVQQPSSNDTADFANEDAGTSGGGTLGGGNIYSDYASCDARKQSEGGGGACKLLNGGPNYIYEH